MSKSYLRSSSRRRSWSPSYFNDTSRRKRRGSSLPVRILIFSLLLALLSAGVGGAYLLLRPVGRASQDTYAYIRDTTSYSQVVEQTIADLDIKTPDLFRRAMKLVKLEEKLRPGRYLISPEMNMLQLYKALAHGAQAPVKISFSSIRTQAQLVERLTDPLAMNSEALSHLLQDSAYCASLGFDTVSIRTMFLPDTHEVYWSITPEDLVKKFSDAYHAFWTKQRLAQAEARGLTPIQVSIIASIVEEESNKPDEYGNIAGLYINRLQKDIALQADPTVKYAAGNFVAQRITGTLLRIDSPYNTYRYKGLPPGPIRYPEQKTIDAVLRSPQHDYLYMCAKADFSGYHAFTASYAEHLKNARAYQRALNERGIVQ